MTVNVLAGAGAGDLSRALGALTVGDVCATRTQGIGVAALDLSASSISTRDPDLFYENGVYYAFYNRVAGTHYGAPNAWKVGLAKGPSLEALVDQGVFLDTATNATTSAAGTPCASCCTVVKEAGVYHFFIGAVDTWAALAKAQIYHFTATSMAGPLTFADVAIADATGAHAIDHGGPVFHNGQWRMAYMEYSTGANRVFRLASASSLAGPWTITSPTGFGGTSINHDAPSLFKLNGRLYMWITGVDYQVYAYDFSDLTMAVYQGPTLIAAGPKERNDPAFGSTAVLVRPDGQVDVLFQGEGTDGYVRIFAARYGAQRIAIPAPSPGGFLIDTVTTGQTKNGAVLCSPGSTNGYSSGDRVPPCTYAAHVMCRVRETSAFTAGEGLRLDGGYLTYNVEMYPQVLNQWVAGSGIVPINPALNFIRMAAIGTVGSLEVQYTITHVWALPL